MRATVTVDEHLLEDLLSVTQGQTYSEAIRKALREYVTWKKWERILTLNHRFEWETDVLPKLEVFRPRNVRERFRFEWEADVLPKLDMFRMRTVRSRFRRDPR